MYTVYDCIFGDFPAKLMYKLCIHIYMYTMYIYYVYRVYILCIPCIYIHGSSQPYSKCLATYLGWCSGLVPVVEHVRIPVHKNTVQKRVRAPAHRTLLAPPISGLSFTFFVMS